MLGAQWSTATGDGNSTGGARGTCGSLAADPNGTQPEALQPQLLHSCLVDYPCLWGWGDERHFSKLLKAKGNDLASADELMLQSALNFAQRAAFPAKGSAAEHTEQPAPFLITVLTRSTHKPYNIHGKAVSLGRAAAVSFDWHRRPPCCACAPTTKDSNNGPNEPTHQSTQASRLRSSFCKLKFLLRVETTPQPSGKARPLWRVSSRA